MTNIWHHAPGIDLDVAAIFDPFGNAVHTALAFPVLGEDVLITGAGPIGIMAAAVARHAGARHVVITDVNEYRLELARRDGRRRARSTSGPSSLADVQRELGMKEGFDVGLEMSGNAAAFRDMIANMCPRRQDRHARHPDRARSPIDWSTVVFNMLTIKGIYGREMYETWYKMTVMLQSGLDIRPVITHRFPYADFEEAFAVRSESARRARCILDWARAKPMIDERAETTSATPQLDEIRAGGLVQGRARRSPRRRAAHVARRGRRGDVLNFCANNYLGLANHPAVVEAARRGARPLGLRHGLGPLHLRHAGAPQAARGAARRLPRHRGHDPLLLLLRRERRALRDAPRRGGRGHLRRAEPRVHHRRHPALQGAAASATRNGDMADLEAKLKEASGARRKLIATDGVFSMDGYIAAAAPASATSPTATTRW